jgi:hypothetical protein
MATPIESFTAVLLQLNMHYKTRVAVKLTGIPDQAAPVGASAPAVAEPPSAKPAGGRKGNGSSGRSAPAEPAP